MLSRSTVSKGAMDLINRLIVIDPAHRLTADQALCHPWVADEAAAALSVLPLVQAKLRTFNWSRKLKNAMRVVRLSMAMQHHATGGGM